MTDLRAACIHGRYDFHYYWSESERADVACPGGRILSLVEVVEWVREQDVDLLERLAGT